MSRFLISRYEVFVYNNGEIEVVPFVDDANLQKCSSSIRQIVGIIEFVLEYLKQNPNNRIHFAVVSAVNHVAYVENITKQSVHTKITRKLNLSMQEFKELLKNCIDEKAPEDNELVKILYGSCVARTKQADYIAVNEIIEKIRNF